MLFDDEHDGLVHGNMYRLPYLPMMGLAPISPLGGALPWATPARKVGAVVGTVELVAAVVAEAAAIATATAVPYIGVAAFVATPNTIMYNIACIAHSRQYLYASYQYNYGWIYQPLLYWHINDMEMMLDIELMIDIGLMVG